MNSLLTKLMPATAALHHAAESALIRVHPCSSVVENSPDRVGPLRPSRPLREASPAPVLKFKYVIIRAQDVETAIIVPAFAQHNWGINLNARRPVSAGFAWRNDDGSITVEGESDSLKLQSRPEDAEIIRQTLIMSGL